MEPVSATTGASGKDVEGSQPPVVEIRQISKRYGQVLACDSVDLVLKRGQIHGILGENGAGKSTLMKILIGLVSPDSGQVILDGKPTLIADPIDAAAKGIGMVHQHFSVIDALTVWENVALGDPKRLDPDTIRNDIGDLSRRYGLELEPDAVVGNLSVGLRQRVEIIKCLRRQPRVMILDEPTSVLTPEESVLLFEGLGRVVDEEGLAIALVSHKLNQVLRSTDVLTIMRRGRVVEHGPTINYDAAGLARAMIGEPTETALPGSRSAKTVPTEIVRVATPSEAPEAERNGGHGNGGQGNGGIVLELSSIRVSGENGQRLLDDLDLSVRGGEILGLAGIEGNGQRVLADLLSSLLPVDRGQVRVDGTKVDCGVAGAMGRAGIAVIPEDHHDSGSIQEMTVAENLILDHPYRMAHRGILDRRRIRARAIDLIERFSIRCEGPDAPMWSLSGGNQQRVVLAREMANGPKVLVAAQPTRGLDIGAIDHIGDQFRAAAAQGVAVLLISSELEEILKLADRIAVISQGRIIGEVSAAEADLQQLGQLLSDGRPASVSGASR